MRSLKLFTAFLLLLTISSSFSSCKKDSGTERGTLPGTWRLTEIWSGIGDGTGNWGKPQESPEVLLTINQDGTISGNVFTEVERFVVIDSSHLQVQLKGLQTEQFITFVYALNGKTLEIQGVCIEGCRYRFVKV